MHMTCSTGLPASLEKFDQSKETGIVSSAALVALPTYDLIFYSTGFADGGQNVTRRHG